MNEIIDADAAWPETQTNTDDENESECDEIIVAGEPRTSTLGDFGDE